MSERKRSKRRGAARVASSERDLQPGRRPGLRAALHSRRVSGLLQLLFFFFFFLICFPSFLSVQKVPFLRLIWYSQNSKHSHNSNLQTSSNANKYFITVVLITITIQIFINNEFHPTTNTTIINYNDDVDNYY